MAKRQSTQSLEKSLQELEQLVVELEHGELPLEESLKRYERAIHLSRHCQQALQDAAQKVAILKDKQPEAFDTTAENPDASE